MKILVISHSAVVSGYQDRYVEVVRAGNIKLTLLVPEKWQQFNRIVRLEKRSDPDYRIVARQPFSWGLKNHGLRNVTHIYPGMKKLIREINPDIIELWEEPFSAVTAQAIHAARKINPDIKIIFFSAQNIRKKYPPPFSWFERYTHRHADFAFVMNRDAQEILQERGWQKGSIVLPLGVNPNRFKRLDASTLRKRLGLNKFTIGFIGKLDRQKGVPDLVKAFGMLKDEANLLIIGEGPMAGPLRNLIDKLDISADSRIIPPVPYSEIPEYLNCMDVLVLPSVTLPGLKEQFGRVLIEAMSCEVPVIGSSSGEIPAIIGDAGLVFPERDLETLLHRLRTIINNPADARDLSRRSRERVLRKYDWKIIARKQIEIYSTLMAPSSSGKGD